MQARERYITHEHWIRDNEGKPLYIRIFLAKDDIWQSPLRVFPKPLPPSPPPPRPPVWGDAG